MRGWDDFEQPQVAGRVEKVGSAEMLFKVFASSLGHQVDGNTRSIGTDQGARFAELLHLIVNDFFDIEAFNHHFNHPIAGGNVLHVVFEIACLYPLYNVFGKDGAWIGFNGCSKGIIYHFVSIRSLLFPCGGTGGGYIEQ